MGTPLQNLESRHAYLCEKLAELQEGDVGTIPNVNGEGEIDHSEAHRRLLDEIAFLDEQIEKIRGREVWQETSRAT